MKNNYHTHCQYCDGKESMENIIEHAVALQYNQLGFSSHAPLAFSNNFAIAEEEIPHYLEDIDRFQKKYPNITLLKGLECDFIPTLTQPFQHYTHNYPLDYLIGGIHLVKAPQDDRLWFIDGSKREIYLNGLAEIFNHDIRKAVTSFWEQTFEMIETQKFDIIAHIDKIKMHNKDEFFTEDETWYVQLIDKALSLLKQKDIIIEMNPRGLYKKRCTHFYPSDYILQQVKKLDIPLVLNSDAHHSNELTPFQAEAREKLLQFGIHETVYFTPNGWQFTPVVR